MTLPIANDGVTKHEVHAVLPDVPGQATLFVCSCGFRFSDVAEGEPSLVLYEMHVAGEVARRIAELTNEHRTHDDQPLMGVIEYMVNRLGPCETAEAGMPYQDPEDAARDQEYRRHHERIGIYKQAWASLTVLAPWLDENEWNNALRHSVDRTLGKLERAMGRELVAADLTPR